MKQQEFDLYGKILTGAETELELVQLMRTQYLKTKMRAKMLLELGDKDDNIADLTKALVLGVAINNDTVTDATLISRYQVYLDNMLAGYGGASTIMDTLEYALSIISDHVATGYYVAKTQIMAETDIDLIRKIDLPGEPVMENEV